MAAPTAQGPQGSTVVNKSKAAAARKRLLHSLSIDTTYCMRSHAPHAQSAFTLLELLVVISLIGLIAGVVAPRFTDLGDKLTLKNQRLEVRQKLNGLPLLALRRGTALRIDTSGAPLQLPAEWHVTAKNPVIYQSNGICLGGEIEVWQGEDRRASITLQPPLCQWPS